MVTFPLPVKIRCIDNVYDFMKQMLLFHIFVNVDLFGFHFCFNFKQICIFDVTSAIRLLRQIGPFQISFFDGNIKKFGCVCAQPHAIILQLITENKLNVLFRLQYVDPKVYKLNIIKVYYKIVLYLSRANKRCTYLTVK